MKYLTYLSFLISVVIFGLSCQESTIYDGSERYRISGKVTDEKGNPLANIPVSLKCLFNYLVDDAITSQVATDGEGNFSLVFSKTDAEEYALFINESGNNWLPNPVNIKYASKIITFDLNRFSDFDLKLNSVSDLTPGVTLFVTRLNNNGGYYESNLVYFDIENNEYLSFNFGENFNFIHTTVDSINSKSLIVPQHSKVKLLFFNNNKWVKDTIFVQDSTVFYSIK